MPVVLTIAGSDSSGGAGLQADLKTFAALGVYGASAVTCVVAEHPGRVFRVAPLPSLLVTAQISAVLDAFPLAAIKIGLLGSRAIVAAVDEALRPLLASGVPLVIDPVRMAGAGGRLLSEEATPALLRLMKSATLITPNLAETAWLTGRKISGERDLRDAAVALAADLAGPGVLAKGGHLRGREAVDWLVLPDGVQERIAAPRVPNTDPHGTGCTYASAIAAHLALGKPLLPALREAKRFLTQALQDRVRLGGYDLLVPPKS